MIEIPVIQLWLAVLTLILGGVGATVGAVWTISNKIRDIEVSTERKIKKAQDEQEQRLKEAQEAGDEKRRRIYERFDEYKAHFESNFIRREMCGLMHNETSKAVTKLVSEVVELRKEIAEVKSVVIKMEAERK